MRNLILGIVILAAGGYVLVQGGLPQVRGGTGGNISGYVNAPKSAVSTTKGVGGAILK